MNRIESDLTGKDKTVNGARVSVHAMNGAGIDYSMARLRQAHAMARAVDLWVRHRSMQAMSTGSPFSGMGRQAFAGGLIVGLSKLLVLDDRQTELVAYIFSLMDGAGRDALRLAGGLLAAGEKPRMRRSFLEGLEEAGRLLSRIDMPNGTDRFRP